jgi:Domain of unknown function (DUF4404)
MTDLQQTLRDLRVELGNAERLSEEDRALLETVLTDIHRVLDAPVSQAAPVEHGDALEGAAVRLEAGHPGLAGAVRAVLDALGKAGI